jgi:1-acyl-sn-glycerol-3-phosphate acyltransferase
MSRPAPASFVRLKADATGGEVRTDAVGRARAVALAVTAGLLVTLAAGLMLPLGALTGFRARRLYASMARRLSLAVLRLYGIAIAVRGEPFPAGQTVYVSNHTSTLDLFVLVALGLPDTRFFLSGFLRKVVPLGILAWMMGTFFTVPQDRPAERTRIFQRAARTLRRTRESVYLSPEGARITTGEIGPFNKGAFHLAADLQAPIVPLYLRIPRDADPGRGYNAGPGVVEVHVLPGIDTRGWQVEDGARHRDAVRALFVRVHERFRCA